MPTVWTAGSGVQLGSSVTLRRELSEQREEAGYLEVEGVKVTLCGEEVSVRRDAHFMVHEAPGAGWGGIVRCDGVRVGCDGIVEVKLQDAMDAPGVRKFPSAAEALNSQGALRSTFTVLTSNLTCDL